MFCSRCGAEIPPDSQFCPKCGRQAGDLTGALARSRLEHHLHILGVFWIALGALFAIPATILMLVGSSIHFMVHFHEPFGPAFGPFLAYAVGGSLLIVAVGGICVGMGLMQHQPWARTAAIVLGVLTLFHPPLGTALGIYTLWVLLADEHGEEYRYLARSG
ncbi:MAG TPA: zinc-ribbon domain-containing protein [Candidatus Aquilonibacter sp.]|nr:zinc-ribbon domain-containing protein [Candidatus Aquilonibacter sp.]